MSAKANPTRIGVFVVGAVVLLAAFLVIFGSGKFFQKANHSVAFFEGSLNGLSIGAPVTFRGVPIGSVTDIKVEFFAETLTSRIPVYFEILPDQLDIIGVLQGTFKERMNKLIDLGLRAQLVSQSLVTGQLAIQLDVQPDTPVRLVGGDPSVVEIPTVPSTIQKLVGELQKLKLEQLVDSANKLVNDIDALITAPEVKEVIPLTLELVDTAKHLVSDIDKVMVPSVMSVVGNANDLVSNLDVEVKPTATSLRDAADAAKDAFDQGKTTTANLDEELSPAMAEVRRLVRNADDLVSDLDVEVKPTATSLRDAIDAAKDAFNQGESTIANLDEELSPAMAEVRRLVRDVAGRLPGTMARLDTVLATVDDRLEPDSVLMKDLHRTLTEFSEAAYAVRALAEELERNPSALIRGK